MRIFIFAGNCIPFHANSLNEKPIGGTETGIIRISERLQQLGHEVRVFSSFEGEFPKSPVHYSRLSEIQQQGSCDVLISVRDWIPLLYPVSAKKRFFWTGDSYDQFSNFGMGDKRVSNQIDAFLAVSRWQAEEISKRSGFPIEKCFVLGNGIEESLFNKAENLQKKRKRLIYSSTPYRGLEFIPQLYLTLKNRHPELELHIFSGYSVYNRGDEEFATLRNQLLALPDCVVHGNVLQKELAQEFLKSSILFYPCHFEETSCITAMEAMAAGCVPLTSHLGALPETIGPAGVLISGKPTEESYIKDFLSAAHRLLSDDALFEDLSRKGKERAKRFSWKNRAEHFDAFLKQQIEA